MIYFLRAWSLPWILFEVSVAFLGPSVPLNEGQHDTRTSPLQTFMTKSLQNPRACCKRRRKIQSAGIRDRQPRTIATKDLPHQVVFLGGWCANCRNLRERQNTHHPQFCTRDVDRRFCRGGAWNIQSAGRGFLQCEPPELLQSPETRNRQKCNLGSVKSRF